MPEVEVAQSKTGWWVAGLLGAAMLGGIPSILSMARFPTVLAQVDENRKDNKEQERAIIELKSGLKANNDALNRVESKINAVNTKIDTIWLEIRKNSGRDK